MAMLSSVINWTSKHHAHVNSPTLNTLHSILVGELVGHPQGTNSDWGLVPGTQQELQTTPLALLGQFICPHGSIGLQQGDGHTMKVIS